VTETLIFSSFMFHYFNSSFLNNFCFYHSFAFDLCSNFYLRQRLSAKRYLKKLDLKNGFHQEFGKCRSILSHLLNLWDNWSFCECLKLINAPSTFSNYLLIWYSINYQATKILIYFRRYFYCYRNTR